jgi:hypothetical protein
MKGGALMFLRVHLAQLKRTTADGKRRCSVRGIPRNRAERVFDNGAEYRDIERRAHMYGFPAQVAIGRSTQGLAERAALQTADIAPRLMPGGCSTTRRAYHDHIPEDQWLLASPERAA